MSLPPFRLSPYFRTRPWGFEDLRPWYDFASPGEPVGEVWLTGAECRVETGPLAGSSFAEAAAAHGAQIFGGAGGECPLLIKVLFPRQKLSVQVHPDDALARRHGEPNGKTECWYVLEASPGAKVALGLRPGAGREQVEAAIAAGTLEELLAWLPVAAGDMIFVDAGTVHAIGPGCVLLETQQMSDLTYRMYDYGSGRELHLDKSLEAMRLATEAGKVAPRRQGEWTTLIASRYFAVEKWENAQGGPAEAVRRVPREPVVQFLFAAPASGLAGDRGGEAQGAGGAAKAAAALAVSVPGTEPVLLPAGALVVVPAGSPAAIVRGGGELELFRILPRDPA